MEHLGCVDPLPVAPLRRFGRKIWEVLDPHGVVTEDEMADDQLEWHLEPGAHGDVVLVAGGDRINLGRRDDAFVRFADFMGDEGGVKGPGHDEHEDPGDFGGEGHA